MLVPHQAGRIQQADRDHRQEQQPGNRGHLVLALECRPQRAAHQQQPQHQADEQIDLPEAADVGVFPALVTEPEVLRQAELVHHRHPLAGERAHHDQDQADEQEVDTQPLELRLMPGDSRGQVQAGGQPGGCDPQDRQLGMPGTGQRIGQDFSQRQTIRGLAFDLVVRGGRAQQDLHQEQAHHHPEVLAHRAHRRRDPDLQRRVGLGWNQWFLLRVEGRVVPDQQRDAGDHQQDAEHRPHEAAGSGRVAHQRLVREVVGIGDVTARALGHRGPRGPEEEARHQAAMLGVRDRVLAQRVGFTQVGHGRVVGENAVVVRRHHFDGTGAFIGNDERVGLGIVGVGAQAGPHLGLEPGLVVLGQFVVVLAVLCQGALVQDRKRFLVQPFGRPVRCQQCAVAPDGTDLLAAEALPDHTSGFEIFLGEDDLTAFSDDFRWKRRCLLVDLATHPQHDGEGDDQQGRQAPPQSFGRIHDLSSETDIALAAASYPAVSGNELTWISCRAGLSLPAVADVPGP